MQNNSTKTLCRCCLMGAKTNGRELLDMNENYFLSNNRKISLAKSYLEVTGCFVAGKLSRMSMDVTKICNFCAVRLQSAYEFRDLSIEANGILEMQYESEKHQSLEIKQLVENEDHFAKSVMVPTPKANKSEPLSQPAGEEGKVSCLFCPRSYNIKSSLNAHILFKHENTQNYKYKCNICSKRCPTNFILKAHYDTHTVEPTHECHICKHSFKHRTYLLQHLKKHSNHVAISFKDLKEAQKRMDIAKAKAIAEPKSSVSSNNY